MIKIYEAYDGKRFNYEDECLEYEAKLDFTKYGKEVKLYDYQKNPINITLETDLEDVLDEICYIKTKSEEEVKAVVDLFNNCGYRSPYDGVLHKIGTLRYIDSGRDGYWENVEYEIEVRQTVLEELK